MRNRVVLPPMTTRLADDEGYVTDATVAYFSARAVGGVGLVTVEMASPEKVGRHRACELGIYDDRFLPGLTRLVDAIHSGGAKASIQLGHAGGPSCLQTRSDMSALQLRGHLRRPLPRSGAELVAQEAAYGRVVFLRDKHRCEVATGS